MQLPEPRFSVMPFGGYLTEDVDAFVDELERATASRPPTVGPDRVRSVAFRSARTRGYSSAEVDQWLDLVADALGAAGASDGTDQANLAAPATRAVPDPGVPTGGAPAARPPAPVPEPSASLVGVVQQRNGLPKPVLLGLIAAVLVVIVLLIYVFG